MTYGSAWETIQAQGRQLADEVRRMVHEGNVRHVVVRQDERVVAEFPLTVALVGALAAPAPVAIGAVAAVLTSCRFDLERKEEAGADAPVEPDAPRARAARPARPKAGRGRAAAPAEPARRTARRAAGRRKSR